MARAVLRTDRDRPDRRLQRLVMRSSVSLSTMTDDGDIDGVVLVVDFIDDPVFSDAKAPKRAGAG